MSSSPAEAALSIVCPEGWQVLPLAEVAYFQEGPGILAKDFREVGVPLLRLKGVEGDYVTLEGCNYLDPEMVARKWNHFRVEEGDLLISTSASLGRVSVVTNESAGGIPYTGLIRFKPRDARLLAGYLKTFLGSAAFVDQAESMASGSVIRHFGPSHIRQMAILVPPLDQQAKIGQLASLLDERLRLLRQTNATLESIAQALFKSWFIDFDPVRALGQGREPEGMDAATAALFPAEFEESESGLIPKGWRTQPFADTVKIMGGGTPKTSVPEFWGGDIPWFSVVDAPGAGQVFTLRTEKSITSAGVENSSTRVLPSWTTIISARGTVGKLAMTAGPMAMNQSCYGLGPKVPGTEPLVYLAAQRLVDDLKRLAHGGVFDTITRETLSSVSVAQPPSDVQAAFSAMVKPVFEKIQLGVERVSVLSNLRDTLLPRLISGKLRLPEAQAMMESTP